MTPTHTDAWLRFLTRCGWLVLGWYIGSALVRLLVVYQQNLIDPIAGVR